LQVAELGDGAEVFILRIVSMSTRGRESKPIDKAESFNIPSDQ
jgi:hypothetical protein